MMAPIETNSFLLLLLIFLLAASANTFLFQHPVLRSSSARSQTSPGTTSNGESASLPVLSFVDHLLKIYCTPPSEFLDKQSILKRVWRQHRDDCREAARSPLLFEDEEEHDATHSSKGRIHNVVVPPYEPIYVGQQQQQQYRIAIQSTEPVFNATTVARIRAAADTYWQASNENRKSRFTFQRPGNYEAHVSDLAAIATATTAAQEDNVITEINQALCNTIYPLIRQVFWDGDVDDDTTNNGRSSLKKLTNRLCVYDALVIRYNATEAGAVDGAENNKTMGFFESPIGSGQPFHRDLGLVSVNIMLNSEEDFVGGGTFFENQLLQTFGQNKTAALLPNPLKPKGEGHFLAHYSSERHAGSATLKGVRDILVIFVTAEQEPSPPAAIQSGMLKQCRSICEKNAKTTAEALCCRMIHQRLAVEVAREDGEAWQYLAVALMEFSDYLGSNNEDFLIASKQCLEQAIFHTPCDYRIFHNLGLVMNRLVSLHQNNHSARNLAEKAFSTSFEILGLLERSHCDVSRDFDALALNYGLFLSYQDRYQEACHVLHHVAKKKEADCRSPIVDDAYRLWSFCKERSEQLGLA